MKHAIQATMHSGRLWSPQYDCASNAKSSSVQLPAASSTSQALFSRLPWPPQVTVLEAPSRRKERTTAQAHLQIYSVAAPNEVVKWWERDLGAKLIDIHSTQELSDAITAAKGKLVIVEFFASWCGSCRALYPKLCKLAAQHKDIVFLKVNFDENKPLCKSLNVKVLPYFHFYQDSMEEMDSFSCSISKLQKLKDAILKYNTVSEDVRSEELIVENS